MATSEIRCSSCGKRNRVPVEATGRPRCGHCRADLPWLVDVDEAGLKAVVRNSSLPVLVDLWAPWCGPCRMVAPALVELSTEMAGSLRIAKVNVDQSPNVSAEMGVQGIPTMLIFNDGVEIARQVGALPKHAIRDWVDQALKTAGSKR